MVLNLAAGCINVAVSTEPTQKNLICTENQKRDHEYLQQISGTSAVAFGRFSFSLAGAALGSFLQQSLLLFFVFTSSILEKDCSQRYVVTKGAKTSSH